MIIVLRHLAYIEIFPNPVSDTDNYSKHPRVVPNIALGPFAISCAVFANVDVLVNGDQPNYA